MAHHPVMDADSLGRLWKQLIRKVLLFISSRDFPSDKGKSTFWSLLMNRQILGWFMRNKARGVRWDCPFLDSEPKAIEQRYSRYVFNLFLKVYVLGIQTNWYRTIS